ncbi:MAG: adenylyl-sulfate kinase [Nitrosomonadales bacterium]|nr:adenylyl-sulfate kinase [Nitrosomonadales bacterium]
MNNAIWHTHRVNKSDRARQNGQRPFALWLTGLSGSGKSTLAGAIEDILYEQGCRCYLLDGDNVRHGLNRDLGFGDADRVENIRRIGEVSKLMLDAGLIVIAAFISPFRADRDMVRAMLEPTEFIELHLDVPLHVCEQRDPKGIYKKARAGEIRNFTGISSPYEAPLHPEISMNSATLTVEEEAMQVIGYLVERGYIKPLRDIPA